MGKNIGGGFKNGMKTNGGGGGVWKQKKKKNESHTIELERSR